MFNKQAVLLNFLRWNSVRSRYRGLCLYRDTHRIVTLLMIHSTRIYSPSAIQDVDECSSSDLENLASLAHQWILCSEWVPSEWESKQLIKSFCFLQTWGFCLHTMLIDGQESCGLLWCFLSAVGLSFRRHPFTAEDPLLSKWCNATFL